MRVYALCMDLWMHVCVYVHVCAYDVCVRAKARERERHIEIQRDGLPF